MPMSSTQKRVNGAAAGLAAAAVVVASVLMRPRPRFRESSPSR